MTAYILQVDHVVRAVADVVALAEVEKQAVGRSHLAHVVSPQVASTCQWFLARFAQTYLLPNENRYSQVLGHAQAFT